MQFLAGLWVSNYIHCIRFFLVYSASKYSTFFLARAEFEIDWVSASMVNSRLLGVFTTVFEWTLGRGSWRMFDHSKGLKGRVISRANWILIAIPLPLPFFKGFECFRDPASSLAQK